MNYAKTHVFFMKEIIARINDKKTIYELTIIQTGKIYSYQNMIDIYRNNYISKSIANCVIAIILFVVGLISLTKWLKARENKGF